MKKVIKDIMTNADNETFSMSKILGVVAVVAMCYRFLQVQEGVAADYQGFGFGVAALIGAFAAKKLVETKVTSNGDANS